jgi:predicted nucleic acid-binding protein
MAQSERHRRHQRVRETPSTRYRSAQPREAVTGVLLDSDIVIEILRGRAQTVADLRATEAQGVSTYCCAIAWAEVTAGVRPGEETLTEAFFNARGEVVIDAETGRRAGGYLLRYAKSHGVEIADALVAAAASTTGLHLWTLNRKHYPMEDLRLYAPPRDR